MKMLLLVLLTSCGFLVGCGDNSKQSQTGAAVSNVVNAPTEYLGTVLKAKQSSEKTLETISINQAINSFAGAEGRYPKDLNELVTTHYLREVPKAPYGFKIVYDATKGEVKVVKQ